MSELELQAKRDITLVRGKNATVWDDKGNEYIDCIAGIAVANVGHCNQKVVAAISEQSSTLITCANSFHNDIREKFIETLCSIAPMNDARAFLCNSGTEAIEAAIKFARHTTGKTEIISAMRGFHGRTFASMSATHKTRDDFSPNVPGFSFVPFNNIEKLKEKITENTAAILLELVQGEGGVHVASKEYVAAVEQLCSESNVLLIIDEIQTGCARTGTFFACEQYNLQPDIVCCAKALGGGVPLGATLCGTHVEVPKGKHGTTFGGNPLACAAGHATIQYIQQNNLAKQAEEKGAHIRKRLSGKLSAVREVRGLGLLIGIECKHEVKQYIDALAERGILVTHAGKTVIRLIPPLTIEQEDLEKVCNELIELLH